MSKFKVEVTEKCTIVQGTLSEILAGLCCYIEELIKIGITKEIIEKVIDTALQDESKENKVETILDNDEMKIQKFDLNNMTKEEAKELLDKEIINKLF